MSAVVEALEGADPEFAVPGSVTVELLGDGMMSAADNCVRDDEFEWMLMKRPLANASADTLSLDYGDDVAHDMVSALERANMGHLTPALHWPGVGTRWRAFLKWCVRQKQRQLGEVEKVLPPVSSSSSSSSSSGAGGSQGGPELPDSLATAESALRGFGQSLGRVVTYRALALDDKGLADILEADCIFPSGQLHVDAGELVAIVEREGVRRVCVARLFIAHLQRLLGHDPSVSLHDDWQTTSIIASAYAEGDHRPVYLFEVSCPVVESMGWTLQEVALQAGAVLGGASSRHPPWFCFTAPATPDGVWFDGRKQRTERYCLYGVPFLRDRLCRLFVFPPSAGVSVADVVAPFARRQAELYTAFTQEQDR